MHCTHKPLTVVKTISRYMCGDWLLEWCSVCCAHEYLHESCVIHTCILYIYVCCICFRDQNFLLSSRRSGGYGPVLVKNIPRIHSEKIFAFMLCWRGLPMIAFILAHCLINPVSLSATCCFSTCYRAVPMCESVAVSCLCLFPHLLWLISKTLQPWGSHSPTEPLPALPYFQTTLVPNDRVFCVILTCLLSTGAPNSTSGPPWIINAPTVGPQTAHCLSYAVFLLESRLESHKCE